MISEPRPVCWIIAGPNGAGKTTFALEYLPRVGCQIFVNADLIASGIAPLAPEGRLVTASRLFLKEVNKHILARRDFGFETTLSGLVYRRLIRRLRGKGWRVELVYLALPSKEVAKNRVAERVRHGGHTIPAEDIERRYHRSMQNFLNEYAGIVDRAICYLNAELPPALVFTQMGARRIVANATLLRLIEQGSRVC